MAEECTETCCSRGGLSTKIHAVVEGLGQLVCWCLTGGQVHSATQATELLDGISVSAVLADKAYDATDVLEKINDTGAKVVIPMKSNRKQTREFDAEHYKNRNVIERFFCRIKQFRRIANLLRQSGVSVSASISLTDSVIWLA